jgi:outer membrane protein
VKTTRQVTPELTFEYFFTDNLSVDLIAASSRHEVAADGVGGVPMSMSAAPGAAADRDLRVAFPAAQALQPLCGCRRHDGVVPQRPPAGGLVQKLNVGFTGGPSVNAGFDYQLVGNWFFNFDVKQMFMRMHAWANDRGTSSPFIKAHDLLDPTVVGAGIEYRF